MSPVDEVSLYLPVNGNSKFTPLQTTNGKHLFWQMAQSDWLRTGQDFSVLPAGNTQFLLPCQENNHKKTLKFNEILFIKNGK
jgi:hypothetical protein